MARRHKDKLRNFLENVAYNGFDSDSKEFFLLVYGAKQQRFTVAVRNYIHEMWEETKEELEDEINSELSDVYLSFAETPKGQILVVRDDLFADE